MKTNVLPEDIELAAAPPSSMRLFVSTFCRNRGAVLGLLVLVIMVIVALLAPSIAPHDPYELFTGKEQLPPSFLSGGDARFFLGTDDAGRDTLSRVMYGARYSLFIGLSATTLAMIAGVSLGLSAAFGPKFGSKAVMLVVIFNVLPKLVIGDYYCGYFRPFYDQYHYYHCLSLYPPFIRLTRATAMVELQREYYIASKVMGASVLRLLFITILPNCMAPLIVQATMIFSSAILEAGAIGFLGFGVQPPDAEWGLC